MEPVTFEGGAIGPDEPTFIIAEAGSNHAGELDTAKELVDVAADAGVDAVKFQTYKAEDHIVKESGGIEYLEGEDRSQYEIYKDTEMPREWIPELTEYAEKQGVLFLSTPAEENSADALDPHVPLFKVESFNLSNHPFLEYLAEKGKPIIVSTGAHEYEEIIEAGEFLEEIGVEHVLLHCVSSYPTPPERINVRAVETLQNEFDVPVGFSDHTLDPVTAPAAAVALGASVVEKHFTLDREIDSPDHEFAIGPAELNEMVTAIRETESVLGSGELGMQDIEETGASIVRRFVQATEQINAGETITEENTEVISAGTQESGIEPKYYDQILGTVTTRTVEQWDGVKWEDLDADPKN